MAWSLRLVTVDDVAERKTQPVDEITITTQLGKLMQPTDDRIRPVELTDIRHDGGRNRRSGRLEPMALTVVQTRQ
ncbi:hypothetical protein ACFWU5_09385 [Nocardia sp. NPDC058640]|uniref:hypothetical protein n=1 Tax=Nocardia sp. NPDC058640 TaxID=3346571 RepID=UPI00364A450F